MILFRRKSDKHRWEKAPDHNYIQQEVGWEYRYFLEDLFTECEALLLAAGAMPEEKDNVSKA